jgi:acetyl esterase
MRILWVIAMFFSWNLYAKDSTCQPSQEISEVLNRVEVAGNPLNYLTRESAPAEWMKREIQARKILAPVKVGAVQDVAVPARNRQIPVRIYTPLTKSPKVEKLPILIFVHGGGWTLGSIATYDSITRTLANRIPAIVVSVDYRLAPEFPYPSGLEDVELAVEWVARNATDLGGDSAWIGIAGDSGGANLATVAARRAKHAGLSLAFQALFYPSTDIGHIDYPSYTKFGSGFLLTKKSVEIFRSFYAPNSKDWVNAEISPLLADKTELALLPPTLIVVAGCDPLRDEGIAYAKKLQENGIKVALREKENLPHGFLGFYNSNQRVSPLIEPILTEISQEIHQGFTSAK